VSTRRRSSVHGRGGGTAGFTLIEMMVVVAVLAIVATVAWRTSSATKPRARLASAAVELQAVIQAARQQALATGHDAAVLFYPNQVTGSGTGRVIVYLDVDGGFMAGTQPVGDPSFCTLDPANVALPAGSNNQILYTVDIQDLVTFAKPPSLVTIPYPYNQVPMPATGCLFCDGTRGAIRFDAKGRATFYTTCGLNAALTGDPWTTWGGSISLANNDVRASRVVIVTPYGSVRGFNDQ